MRTSLIPSSSEGAGVTHQRLNIERLQPGQVWWHYGWCRWYVIKSKVGYGVNCLVYRPDGSSYHTFVLQSFVVYGGRLMFNKVRVKVTL